MQVLIVTTQLEISFIDISYLQKSHNNISLWLRDSVGMMLGIRLGIGSKIGIEIGMQWIYEVACR